MISGALNPPREFGRFLLTAKVASGGMATVYRAEVRADDPLHGKPLALKVLHEHLTEKPEFIRMFKDEGRIVQHFDHPNVIRVYEVGEAEGAHYLAMELVDGRDLAQLLVAHRLNHQIMAAGPTFEILRQALTALRYVHGYKGRNGRVLGVVHRDISPQNLLISRQPLVKLTDFGIARGDHRSDRTRTGTVKGKMHYMAPEQASGERVDARADLYALGAVAYEMLTGKPLFGPGTTEVLHLRARQGQVEFGAAFDRLPEDVKAWLRKALAVNPDERYQNADAMLADMERLQKATKAQFRPEQLQRLMDLPEARRSRQRDQRLFGAEEESSGRAATGAVLSGGPARRESSLARTSHHELDVKARMDRLGIEKGEPRVDWTPREEVALRPVASARDEAADRSRRRSQVRMLPAEVAAGRSYEPDGGAASARTPPRQAAQASSRPVDRLEPSSLKNPKPILDDAPAETAAASKTSRKTAAVRASLVVPPEQQGLALASTVAWLCGALVAFAVLLEVVGVHVQLPVVDDHSVASLWDEDEPAEARTDAIAVSPGKAAQPGRQSPASLPVVPARAAPVLRPAGRLEIEADTPAIAPEKAARDKADEAEKAEKPAPVVRPAAPADPEAQARAERAAQRMVEEQAERRAWADKPLESVARPDDEDADARDRAGPAVARPAVAKPLSPPKAAPPKGAAAGPKSASGKLAGRQAAGDAVRKPAGRPGAAAAKPPADAGARAALSAPRGVKPAPGVQRAKVAPAPAKAARKPVVGRPAAGTSPTAKSPAAKSPAAKSPTAKAPTGRGAVKPAVGAARKPVGAAGGARPAVARPAVKRETGASKP